MIGTVWYRLRPPFGCFSGVLYNVNNVLFHYLLESMQKSNNNEAYSRGIPLKYQPAPDLLADMSGTLVQTSLSGS
jgi:hypothetical protein